MTSAFIMMGRRSDKCQTCGHMFGPYEKMCPNCRQPEKEIGPVFVAAAIVIFILIAAVAVVILK